MFDPARLTGVGLFDGLEPAALRELAARGRVTRFTAGETLWVTGTGERGLHVILSGRVRVTGDGAGRSHRVHVEGPGGTLGEVPLFDGGSYPATAIAETPTECAVFTRGVVRAAIAADPELAFRLLSNLGSRVRGLVERLDALVGLDVRQRLAAHLHARWEQADGDAISLGSTQAALAEDLGTVREVVVRALRQLTDAGAIERDRCRIRVIDPDLLERLSR
jgi:CRP/FNR family transcriptional regulator